MTALLREPRLEPRVVRIDGRDETFLVPTFAAGACVLITTDTTEKIWRKPEGVVLVEIKAIGAGGGGGRGAAGAFGGPAGSSGAAWPGLGAGGAGGGLAGVDSLRPLGTASAGPS